MPPLTIQFDAALSNIEPTVDDRTNAPLAHSEVSEALSADDIVAGWGFAPILIGSYKRRVSIRRIKDVDVFGRLNDLDDDVLPKTLLGEFERVLRRAFPTVDGLVRVKRQARSLQVAFPQYDGLYVDAVPARPWISPEGLAVWQLPRREDGDDPQGWQATNPEMLGAISTELNDAEHADGHYIPTVKLLRQTRRSLLGKRKPGGLTVELAAVHAFRSGRVHGPTPGDFYATALQETAAVLHDAFVLGRGLDDPTMPGQKAVIRGSNEDKQALAEAFVEAATRATTALHSVDKCAAAKSFRELLGPAVDDVGDTGYVFPMPETCNLDGTTKLFAAVTAGDRTVPGGDRRFG